jgi:hypothetical protein
VTAQLTLGTYRCRAIPEAAVRGVASGRRAGRRPGVVGGRAAVASPLVRGSVTPRCRAVVTGLASLGPVWWGRGPWSATACQRSSRMWGSTTVELVIRCGMG